MFSNASFIAARPTPVATFLPVMAPVDAARFPPVRALSPVMANLTVPDLFFLPVTSVKYTATWVPALKPDRALFPVMARTVSEVIAL